MFLHSVGVELGRGAELGDCSPGLMTDVAGTAQRWGAPAPSQWGGRKEREALREGVEEPGKLHCGEQDGEGPVKENWARWFFSLATRKLARLEEEEGGKQAGREGGEKPRARVGRHLGENRSAVWSWLLR